MLTYQKYLSLDEELQTQILSIDGIYLGLSRNLHNYKVELYSLYNFYVEIFFNQLTEEPLYLKPFKTTRKLDPYLKKINIDGILGSIREGF
jgi:hypothetical protein